MSVIMTLGQRFVTWTSSRPDGEPESTPDVSQRDLGASAGGLGAIGPHRFYGSDGQIMVVDEWPDAASFQAFFAAEQEAIGPLMAQVATSEPEIIFWRELETGDAIGWE